MTQQQQNQQVNDTDKEVRSFLPGLPGFPGGGTPGGPPPGGGFPPFPGGGGGFPGGGPGSFPGGGFPGGPGGGFPGGPGGGFPGGVPGGAPAGANPPGSPQSPPPSFIPQKSSASLFAVDPGSIRRCVFRYVYIWQDNGDQYWMYLTHVGRNSISGFRWFGYGPFGFWLFFGLDLRRIDQFSCF